MADNDTRFATEKLVYNGVTFNDQGKPQFSPTAQKVLDAYRQEPGASDEVTVSQAPGTGLAGVAWSPSHISVNEGGDVRTLAHELTHTTQPEITMGGKIQGLVTGQPVTAAPLAYLDSNLNRLARTVTRPSKGDLLDAYKHRVQKTFDAEVDAQAGMTRLIRKVIPSYNPEARKSKPGEFASGKPEAPDGWYYSGYPAMYMEKAISEANRLGRGGDEEFNKKVADLRWDYNTQMKNEMGTTYSPNPYR